MHSLGQLLALAVLVSRLVDTRGASLSSRYATVANYYDPDPLSASPVTSRRRRYSSPWLLRRNTKQSALYPSVYSSSSTLLASSKTVKKNESKHSNDVPSSRRRKDTRRRQDAEDDNDDFFGTSTTTAMPQRQITYRDLSPFGKMVAGTVEVCVATVLEYLTGFSAGYAIGIVTDIPRLLFRSVEAPSEQQDQIIRTMWQEMAGRTARMNGKSLKWAKR